ncbi:phosphoinositide-3-kinase-interacting protein 1 isoform X1 [Rhincodon typus]|uniref:phosphoinositide-3-kinase-interacting protein 1 isoform X1 n=2 Tax=Rhincodon typus TaxID=259920 RepID=UPI00202DCCED|nr:phosphoinositide-3-kinase-interacting protein 1 isoform X1 [Rhincodon typus]
MEQREAVSLGKAGRLLGAVRVCSLIMSIHFLGDTATAQRTDCILSNGMNYRGDQQITSQGLKCVNWMHSKRDYNLTLYPDRDTGVGDHQFCRNPDDADGPWCYVKTPNEERLLRQSCSIGSCNNTSLHGDLNATTVEAETVNVGSSAGQIDDEVISVSSKSSHNVKQPVIGIRPPVRQTAKEKKDLGVLGQALAIGMMTILIVLGVSITLGYIYKRGRDLKKEQEQRANEREMHRIMLPLSAFSNPNCELIDEITLVVESPQTETDEGQDEDRTSPLVGPAGTPGA